MTIQYEIKPVMVNGAADANGVYVNQDGAWLGEVAGDSVEIYADDGDYIPAPQNWRELIVRELK